MNNKTGFNALSRRAGHRKALIKNMVTSLFKYERITTTKAKAQEVRKAAEKMVTRAKVDSVHNRRQIARVITDGDILKKVFTVLGPRYEKRPGGYTRILKLGRRFGDAAEMVILELVDRPEAASAETAAAPAAAEKPAPKAKAKAKTAQETEAPAKKAPAKKTAKKDEAAE